MKGGEERKGEGEGGEGEGGEGGGGEGGEERERKGRGVRRGKGRDSGIGRKM